MPSETNNTEIIVEKDSKPSRFGEIFNVFSYIAAIGVGAFVADSQIRVANYKQKRRAGVFNTRHKTLEDSVKKLWHEAASPDEKERESLSFSTTEKTNIELFENRAFKEKNIVDATKLSVPQKEKVLRDCYRNMVKDWYDKRGMKTLKDFWTPLQDHDKIKVAVEAFTVGGIALGVLLTIGNTKSVSQFFARHSPSQRPKTNVDRLAAQNTDQPASAQGR